MIRPLCLAEEVIAIWWRKKQMLLVCPCLFETGICRKVTLTHICSAGSSLYSMQSHNNKNGDSWNKQGSWSYQISNSKLWNSWPCSLSDQFRLQLMLLAHAWTASTWATRISLLSKNLLLLKCYSPIIAINNWTMLW